MIERTRRERITIRWRVLNILLVLAVVLFAARGWVLAAVPFVP